MDDCLSFSHGLSPCLTDLKNSLPVNCGKSFVMATSQFLLTNSVAIHGWGLRYWLHGLHFMGGTLVVSFTGLHHLYIPNFLYTDNAVIVEKVIFQFIAKICA